MSGFYVKLLLLLLLCRFSADLNAQTPDQLIQIGDKLYESGEYYGSIGFYEKALNLDSTNAEVLYKYGRNLYKINRFNKATRYLLKSSLLGGKTLYPNLTYELAESYRHAGDYRKARRHYTTALRSYRQDRDSYWYKRINQSKDAAEWADDHSKEKADYQIINWGEEINSTQAEYGATVLGDQLYFASLRADSSKSTYVIKDKEYFSRLFYSPLKQYDVSQLKLDDKLSKATKNKHLLNLNTAEEWTYFSLCDSNYQCEIWKGKLRDNRLTNAEKLNTNINLQGSNNTQAYPTVIDNQNYLFFVSNRNGGFGGLDLWVAKEADFGFDKAVNVGAVVNSIDNEVTPYYNAKTQTLYFSSNWHLGFGAYDIFRAKGKINDYKAVENLGQPINSFGNDYYFQQFGDSALLSSNRLNENTGGVTSCCNDLYKLAFEKEKVEIKEEQPKTLTKRVTSEVDIDVDVEVLNQYLPSDLYFHNDIPQPSSADTLTNANYINIAYEYLDMTDEYLSAMEKVKVSDDDLDNLSAFFEENVKKGIKSLEYFSPLLLKELEKGSDIELSILGFASAVSKEDYNYKLTLRRIESLINYFKSYKNGVFLPYIQKTASNGGSLKFIKLPFGEFAFSNDLDLVNKTKAVYSLEAVKQRKIELIAITKQTKGEQAKSSISFNTKSYQLGQVKSEKMQRFFQMNNEGNADLKIYNVTANCECVNLEYPTKIAAKSSERLIVNINTQDLKGDVKIELTVVTDTKPNFHYLTIEFTL
jgi:hypothetical protein